MKLTRLLVATVLAGCGGAADPEFLDAAPSFADLAMDQADSDTNESAQALLAPGERCHPHLFLRTREVVTRVNRHLFKFLRHVGVVMLHRPKSRSATSHVWEKERDGVTVRFTMNKNGKVFDWLLEGKADGAADFTTLFTGTIDRTDAAGPHQGRGTLDLSLTGLHAVFPNEHLTGALHADFANGGASRQIVVDAVDVAWQVTVAADVLPAEAVTALETPRNAHYVYYREPGTGGSLKITDEMVFLCPTNDDLKIANVDLVARWYRAEDDSVRGRSDAVMTGGQLPDYTPAIDRIVGVTCYRGSGERTLADEGFWLMKAEAADGSTIVGADTAIQSSDSSACDPVFGAVPTLEDDANDFVMPSAAEMASDEPYPVP